jgi:hypothetical protein
MAYSDFTLEQVEIKFGVTTDFIDLFPGLAPLPIPAWLQEALKRGTQLALLSEKARSEFIVAPILLTCRELSGDTIAIYSGQSLNVDPEKGLSGECDFILSLAPPLPVLHAPLMTILEAKKSDIDLGLGQCAAQMMGARRFNEQRGRSKTTIFGAVTSGDRWQFLRLEGSQLGLDRQPYHLANLGTILAVIQAMIAASAP